MLELRIYVTNREEDVLLTYTKLNQQIGKNMEVYANKNPW